MAAYNLVTIVDVTGKNKRIVSSSSTVDFLSIKVGASALELKETSGNFDASGHKLVNLGAPSSNSTDAATTAYVDAAVAATGTSAEWQNSVLTATILDPTNISGSPTAGDRYLINGTGAGGWSGKDNQIAQYVSGSKTSAGSYTYTVPTTGTFTSADDANTVLYYFGGSSWTTKSFEATTASGFLSKVGNDIQLTTLLSGKIILGNGSNVATAVTPTGDVTISNAGATTIANDAVTTVKILDSNVTAAKLASDSVTTVKILDSNVTAAKLATDSVTTVKIVDSNVTAAKLATDSVTTVKIVDANVTQAKLATDSVSTVKIVDANVTAAKLATDSVQTVKIVDLNVTTAKLAATSVTAAKLGSDVAGSGLTGGNGAAIAILDTEAGTNDNAGTITIRQVVYEKSNGNWDKAIGTDSTNLGLGTRIGLVADATILTTASGNITTRRGSLVSGFSSLTIDAPVYISRATAGAVVQDLSAFVAGDQVVRVGFAKSASVVVFDPDFLFEF